MLSRPRRRAHQFRVRGGTNLDEDAVYRAVIEDILGAGGDVFAAEPPTSASALSSLMSQYAVNVVPAIADRLGQWTSPAMPPRPITPKRKSAADPLSPRYCLYFLSCRRRNRLLMGAPCTCVRAGSQPRVHAISS
jgi:hypothetical protein